MHSQKHATFVVTPGMRKAASTRLRSMFRLVNPERRLLDKTKSLDIFLGKNRIGNVEIGRPATGDLELASLIIDNKFQGMGLGKKLYGELMRLSPSGHILSPPRRSSQAAHLWNSIRRRTNDYTVTEVPAFAGPDLPSFRARLARPTPRKTPIAFEYRPEYYAAQ